MVYLVAYLWVIDAQDGAVAWWYVGLMVLAALSFAAAALGTWARAALTVGLVISAPRHAGRPVEPRRTAGTDCRRGRHRTRGYTPGRTRTCGDGRTTTESATRGFPLAGRLRGLRRGA